MNRRNFIQGLLTAGAGFMVLPSAGRLWKAVIDPKTVVNPNYVSVLESQTFFFDPHSYIGEWRFIMDMKEYPMNAGYTRSPILYKSQS